MSTDGGRPQPAAAGPASVLAASRPPALRAALALARVEGVRLLRQPLVWLASAVILWQWVAEQVADDPAGRHPALQRADTETQTMLLLLAAAALVAANLAALRAHRHGTEDLARTLPLPQWLRTLGHLLSVLPVALLGALLAGGRIAQLATLPGAVGRPDPVELATGPVLVVLGGALGVLLARRSRSALAAPLAVLLLTGSLYVVDGLGYSGGYGGYAARYLWLGLHVPQTWSWRSPAPADLLGRPAGWHLAYLAGIVLLVAVAALLRAGGPRWRLRGVAAATLAATVLAGSAQLRPPAGLEDRRAAAVERPAGLQVCQRRGPATYCVFPEFARRAGDWDRTVQAILRRVPAGTAPPLVVRQQLDPAEVYTDPGLLDALVLTQREANRRAGTATAITLGTSWGDEQELTLATTVAFRVAGSPARKDPDAGGDTVPSTEPSAEACGAPAVVALWLAAQASPGTTRAVRAAVADAAASLQAFLAQALPGETHTSADVPGIFLWTGGTFNAPDIDFGHHEAALAAALLDRPADQVGQALRRHWRELSSTATSSARAAELLAVRLPAGDPLARAAPRSC
ncbi:MAG TPA: hypothetical protein VKG45_05700 [Actinomycetes bacterium]|nr:hypothetical protein [Actinomycetes bacterium]